MGRIPGNLNRGIVSVVPSNGFDTFFLTSPWTCLYTILSHEYFYHLFPLFSAKSQPEYSIYYPMSLLMIFIHDYDEYDTILPVLLTSSQLQNIPLLIHLGTSVIHQDSDRN